MGRDQTLFRRFVADFFSSPTAVVGLAVLGVILVAAIAAPLISPQNPYALAPLDPVDGALPPGTAASRGGTFWLGSDERGRDMLSAILYGLRISLAVGGLSTIIALAIGLTLGLAAVCCGGRSETLIMWVADIELSFPAILIVLALLLGLGQGLGKIVAALVAVQWAHYARTLHDTARIEKRKEYIEAARCLALSPTRIVLRHLLPNCLPPLFVVANAQAATAIMLEATLSFLGLGLPLTEPSLGLLIANGNPYLHSGKYWMSFFPGIALLLTLASLNLVAEQLRDMLNLRQQR